MVELTDTTAKVVEIIQTIMKEEEDMVTETSHIRHHQFTVRYHVLQTANGEHKGLGHGQEVIGVINLFTKVCFIFHPGESILLMLAHRTM